MLAKLFGALGVKSRSHDWESMLTQVDDDGTVSRPVDSGLPDDSAGLQPKIDMSLALMGLSGEEVAKRATELAKSMRGLAEMRNVSVHDWNVMIRELSSIADMGNALHALAEIKMAKVTPSVEATKLLPVVGGVLAKRVNHLRRSGVVLVPELQPCTVMVNPDLARALVEAAVDWATPFGNRLAVSTGMSSWGDVARLEVCADEMVRTQDMDPKPSRTSMFLWELLVELSTVAGVRLRRGVNPGRNSVTLEFTSEARSDGVGNDRDYSVQENGHQSSGPVDLVVFTSGRTERMMIDKVLSRAELKARYVSSTDHLVRECEMQPPNALIIEQLLMDRPVRTLIDDLNRHLRHFSVIVLVPEPNVYDMSGPGLGSYCRLSATNIDSNLKEALMFELARL